MGNRAGLLTTVSLGALLAACSSGIDDLRFSESVGGDASVGGNGNAGSGGIGGGTGGVIGDGGTGGGGGTGNVSGGGTGGGGTGGVVDGGTFNLAAIAIHSEVPGSQPPDNVTWATWEPVSQKFFLLQGNSILRMSKDGLLEDSLAVPMGTVAQYALAASPDTVFFIVDDSLYRMQHDGTYDSAMPPLQLPVESNTNPDDWNIAWASGWLTLTNIGLPLSALQDGTDAAFTYPPTIYLNGGGAGEGVSSVVTDDTDFLITVGTTKEFHIVNPPDFLPDSSPCESADTTPRLLPSFRRDTIAWANPGFGQELALYFGTVIGDSCSQEEDQTLPQPLPQPTVGLIDSTHALIVENVATASTYSITVGIRERNRTTAVTTLPSLDVTGLSRTHFVMGVGAWRAVLVTGREPLLLSY